MPDKDVDEQFAAIMAHWDEVALGLDPFGDPLALDAGDASEQDPDVPDAVGDPREASETDKTDAMAEGAGLDEPDTGADLARSAESADGARAPVTAATPPTVTAPEATPAPAADRAGAPTPPAGATAPAAPALPDDVPPVIGAGWRQHDPPDLEEHFVPPPPAPLPSADDKHFWLMMVGLFGGPLLFLWLLIFDRDGNGWWMVFALGIAIAGFVLLVLRQPAQRDENDDGVRL